MRQDRCFGGGGVSVLAIALLGLAAQPSCTVDRSGFPSRGGSDRGCYIAFDPASPGAIFLGVGFSGDGRGLFVAEQEAWAWMQTASPNDDTSILEVTLASGDVLTVTATTEVPRQRLRIDGPILGGGTSITLGRCLQTPGLFVSNTRNLDIGTFSLWEAPLDRDPEWTTAFAPSPTDPSQIPFPVAGDWDGNGLDSPGGFDAARRTFFLSNDFLDTAAQPPFEGVPTTFVFPDISASLQPDDLLRPVAGDWNNDGSDSVGLFATRSMRFFLVDELTPGASVRSFTVGGGRTDDNLYPVAGDWNGDGMDSTGIYNSGASGRLRLFSANAEMPPEAFRCDLSAGQRPSAGAWRTGDGDGIALFVPAPATEAARGFRLYRLDGPATAPCVEVSRFAVGPGAATTTFQGLLPIFGNWSVSL